MTANGTADLKLAVWSYLRIYELKMHVAVYTFELSNLWIFESSDTQLTDRTSHVDSKAGW